MSKVLFISDAYIVICSLVYMGLISLESDENDPTAPSIVLLFVIIISLLTLKVLNNKLCIIPWSLVKFGQRCICCPTYRKAITY